MKSIFLWVALWLVLSLALLVPGCGSGDDDDNSSGSADDDDTIDDDTEDDDPVDDDSDDGDTGDFFPPDRRGPCKVGVTTIYLVDESRYENWGDRFRTLPVELWYPSTGVGGKTNTMPEMIGDLPDWMVSLLELIFGDRFDELWSTTTTALRDAEPLFSDGPFPVFFFSHGFLGLRFQNYTTCEHLASHGIICVGVDHYGNAIFTNLRGTPDGGIVPYNPLDSLAIDKRVGDVNFVYHELERINRDAVGPWFGLFDLEKFVVGGHSLGGMTSIRSGAEFDFVKAVAPINPAWFGPFPGDFDLPFFMLQGAQDAMIGEATNAATKGFLLDSPSNRKVYINLLRGGHYSSTDVCTLVPPLLNFLTVECLPPFIDVDLANDIFNAYLTAFLKPVLDGDDRYAAYLERNHYPDEIDLLVVWE